MKIRARTLPVGLLLCCLLAGCAEMLAGPVFFANSTPIGWEGSVADVAFKQHGRYEGGGRTLIRLVLRPEQGESYLLTIDFTVDGRATRLTVARGSAFPSSTRGWSYPDFIEDMSDGNEHFFALEKSSAKSAGVLRLRMTR